MAYAWHWGMNLQNVLQHTMLTRADSKLNLEPRLIFWFVSTHAPTVPGCWGGGGIKTIQMLWELTCEYSRHTELQTVAIIWGKLYYGQCLWVSQRHCTRESEDWYVQTDNIINSPCMAYPADTNSNKNDRYIFGQISKTINIFWQ